MCKHLSWHREQCYSSVVTAIWSCAFTFVDRDYYAFMPFLYSQIQTMMVCSGCIASTVLDVFWIDASWSCCLTHFHPFHGFVCFHDCGWGGVNERIWCGCSGIWGGSEDRFNKAVKYSCHLATTDSLSDNSFTFADFSGVDKILHFCLNCQKLANVSLILPQRRWYGDSLI